MDIEVNDSSKLPEFNPYILNESKESKLNSPTDNQIKNKNKVSLNQ